MATTPRLATGATPQLTSRATFHGPKVLSSANGSTCGEQRVSGIREAVR